MGLRELGERTFEYLKSALFAATHRQVGLDGDWSRPVEVHLTFVLEDLLLDCASLTVSIEQFADCSGSFL